MKKTGDALSEVVGESLMILLILLLAGIIIAIVFGVLPFVAKTAYLVPDLSIRNVSGHSVVALFNRGGDPVSFDSRSEGPYTIGIYIDTSSGTYRAEPVPSLGMFRPGDTLFIASAGSTFLVTDDPDAVSSSLPHGTFTVRLLDETGKVLIASREFRHDVEAAVTTTASPTTTATPSTTATITVTPTATPQAPHTITVTWSPRGLGTVSPPGTNGGSVSVAHGSGQVFSAVPKPNKAVLAVTLDGVTIYSGSTTGATITCTVNNVMQDHALAVWFG